MKSFAWRRLWRGLQTGDRVQLGLGVLALVLAWWRRPQTRELLHREVLEPGETFVVEMKPAKPDAT